MKKRKTGRAKYLTSMVVLGVAWYVAEDWARMKATADDPELFEATFAEWESMATAKFEIVRKRFPNLLKVYVVADEFFLWCHLHAQPNNSRSRSEFVTEKADIMARA